MSENINHIKTDKKYKKYVGENSILKSRQKKIKKEWGRVKYVGEHRSCDNYI